MRPRVPLDFGSFLFPSLHTQLSTTLHLLNLTVEVSKTNLIILTRGDVHFRRNEYTRANLSDEIAPLASQSTPIGSGHLVICAFCWLASSTIRERNLSGQRFSSTDRKLHACTKHAAVILVSLVFRFHTNHKNQRQINSQHGFNRCL